MAKSRAVALMKSSGMRSTIGRMSSGARLRSRAIQAAAAPGKSRRASSNASRVDRGVGFPRCPVQVRPRSLGIAGYGKLRISGLHSLQHPLLALVATKARRVVESRCQSSLGTLVARADDQAPVLMMTVRVANQSVKHEISYEDMRRAADIRVRSPRGGEPNHTRTQHAEYPPNGVTGLLIVPCFCIAFDQTCQQLVAKDEATICGYKAR